MEKQLRISIASATTLEALEGLDAAIADARPDVVLRLATLLFRQTRDVLANLGDDVGAREAERRLGHCERDHAGHYVDVVVAG